MHRRSHQVPLRCGQCTPPRSCCKRLAASCGAAAAGRVEGRGSGSGRWRAVLRGRLTVLTWCRRWRSSSETPAVAIRQYTQPAWKRRRKSGTGSAAAGSVLPEALLSPPPGPLGRLLLPLPLSVPLPPSSQLSALRVLAPGLSSLPFASAAHSAPAGPFSAAALPLASSLCLLASSAVQAGSTAAAAASWSPSSNAAASAAACGETNSG